MPPENPLTFARALNQGRGVAPLTVIYGPLVFLREFVLDLLRRKLAGLGFKYRALQIGAGDSYSGLLSAIQGGDLFAPTRLVVGRILRSFRDRGGNEDSDIELKSGSSDDGEALLIRAFKRIDTSIRVALVYERDKIPVRMRRVAEDSGAVVNCLRPFDNQLAQYAELFAQVLGLKLTRRAADLLVARHAGDLAAIANALTTAAIRRREDGTIDAADLGEPGATRIPDLFEIAESLTQRSAGATLALFQRALQSGRDPIDVLALEVIPQVRRMLLAASLLARKKDRGEIAAAMGLPPTSLLATAAIDGAQRFGLKRLEHAHQRAAELDASFKMGLIKERDQAVAALILDLAAPW